MFLGEDMSIVQDVSTKEDFSVERKIKKVAKRLNSKYSKKRKVNEKLLKEHTGVKKVFLVLLNIFFVVLIILASLLCISCIVSRVNGTVPTFAGYSLMRISSGSMEESGFDVGDNIVVKAVDVNTLRVGDNIAFYVYKDSYSTFNRETSTKLNLDNTKIKYDINFLNFFGFPSKEIKQAVKADSTIVFHQISAIYQDQNGQKWFETKGTSNVGVDNWMTNEAYVVGIHNNSAFAKGLVVLLNYLTKNTNFLLLVLIPFAIFTVLIIFSFAKDIQRAKLELDVVEEKRKLTDEICVKNGIGFSMDKKTKYKVLAQAGDDEKEKYISLLWKDGTAPTSIKKYYIRKKIFLSGMKKLLNLNRKCEKMLKDGEKAENVAKYYLYEKEKILQEQKTKETRIKNIRRKLNEQQV